MFGRVGQLCVLIDGPERGDRALDGCHRETLAAVLEVVDQLEVTDLSWFATMGQDPLGDPLDVFPVAVEGRGGIGTVQFLEYTLKIHFKSTIKILKIS